jgi:hypothetical protein
MHRIASARELGLRASHNNPLLQCSTLCRLPGTSVAIKGRAIAATSSSERRSSLREGGRTAAVDASMEAAHRRYDQEIRESEEKFRSDAPEQSMIFRNQRAIAEWIHSRPANSNFGQLSPSLGCSVAI